MKKLFFTLMATFFGIPLIFGNIITVSNNPGSPGQFRRLDSAIAAANNNDILLVSGSVTDYNINGSFGGSITINKPLVLYGQGYDPRKDQALASLVSVFHISVGGSGTIISGFSIGSIYEDAGTNNITISRSGIGAFGYNYGGNGAHGINGNNYNIRENLIGSITIAGNDAGIIIQNNIIGSISSSGTNTNIVITNNYFPNPVLMNLSNANVYNNIFYFKSTSASTAAYFGISSYNNVFRNNIYYNTTNSNPLNIGIYNNSGNNNINANPNFENIVLSSTNVLRPDNFNLKFGSPGMNAGTDSTNIGPHGGSLPMQYPYSGEPAIPQVKLMDILNPVIPPNGTLNVNFKARSNN